MVVTDSTASLPPAEAERWGIEVVPLEVAVGDVRYREGVDLDPTRLVRALQDGTRVTTSQPAPAAFAAAYARAAGRGADAIVSLHLSGDLSGTVRGAGLAAAQAAVPVHVVDSRSVAMGLGFAALAAARAARAQSGVPVPGEGASADVPVPGVIAPDVAVPDAAGADVVAPDVAAAHVVARASEVAASASALFAVDSLEHLRRGGRIGAAAEAVGTLLGTRPLLTVDGGRVEVAGTARTRRAARARLVDVAATAATRERARVAVHHLGQHDVAEVLAAEIRDRLGDGTEVLVVEVSAVLGAHAGPGVLGVVVAEG
ncbi:DegV family protein [uncultured Cellulomonas sp.]|uniref:DegV family protein n=1 Tax=uncultured Cellulomonas sp. TaxID=189682 RepID=UPI00260190D3|nr:DegV family protein [uncultured Cellulomonas sp.]